MTIVLVLVGKSQSQFELLSTNLAIDYVAFVEFALGHSQGISILLAIEVVLSLILHHRVAFV